MSNEEMAQRAQNGEKGLILALWEQNIKFFRAKSYGMFMHNRGLCASSGVELDDIFQSCFFALLDAVRAYKAATGHKLLTYARFPLMNRFRALVGLRTTRRNPLDRAGSLDAPAGDDESDATVLDLVADPESAAPFEAADDELCRPELRAALNAAIGRLPGDRAATIRWRYFEGRSAADIAAELGVEPMRVYGIEQNALRDLRRERSLLAFREELLAGMAYNHIGLRRFKETWESSVERAVIRADELTERERGR
jgi:RNA polymerase sigma factor (sigma-70 family)